MGVLEIFEGCLEIYDGCPGYIRWVSWRYLLGVLEIFGGFPEDILLVSR